jgi:hypothetical protein
MFDERWIEVERVHEVNSQCCTQQWSGGIESFWIYVAEIASHVFWKLGSIFFVNFLARCWDVFCAVTMLSLCWSVFVIFGPCNEVLGMLHIVWNYPMRKILSIWGLGWLFGSHPRWNHKLQPFGGMWLVKNMQMFHGPDWMLATMMGFGCDSPKFQGVCFCWLETLLSLLLTGTDIIHKTRPDAVPKQKLEC